MEDLQLNVSEIIDKMSVEIANLKKSLYIKEAEVQALRALLEKKEQEVDK